MSDFVHLHCHTEYSLLDGAIRIKDLCQQALNFGQNAVAITDHGNLYGAIDFYETAKKFGLKPIIGCEVYVAPEHRTIKKARSASSAGFHLVLLAQNQEGYHNLIKLVSSGFLEGFYYKPRVDKEILSKWNKGLIALSACLKGEIPQAILNQDLDQAKATLNKYQSIFPGRFYLELQSNGLPEQEKLNQQLLELAEATKTPLVATNDCHYLSKEDVEAHDVLICIQTNAKVQDTKRMRMSTDELYYKSPQEMKNFFNFCPQALDSVAQIAKQCNVELELGKHHFPVYDLPPGLTLEKEFQRLAREGLKQRLKELPYQVNEEIYWQRLERELEVICQKGFAGYFLIVQDFINWAKGQGIPVGPGRGSAAGSLAAFSLGITNLDPIKYNLLFERFLNVERESLPDIDVDFCYTRREEVINYVTQKYGKQNVAQITTFGSMKAKAAVKDVGRALGLSYAQTDKIAKLIPDSPKITIDQALDQEPELQKLVNSDPQLKKLIDISRRLEGLSRHASTHAAGIVISDKPMQEYLPLYLGKKGEVVTQYDMKKVEKVGLIKFDFLGLKTLTVLDDALQLIKKQGLTPPNLDTLPLDDKETFSLLCKGQTQGVFQLESPGMRQVLIDLKPTCFEDIIALLALYRPGPLDSGMVSEFIKAKHGEIDVKYPHPSLEPILKETYGVILYQEQVMRIASDLANYSLGDGDILRRAMGKKNPEVMAKQRSKFLEGTKANNIPDQTANHIFDLMEKFAGYGFNKSHSAAYALISYQTAYLKAHYPKEFMAALLTSEVSNPDKVLQHINNCKEMGIAVLPPDINQSYQHFTVTEQGILFGLAAVKDVGKGAIAALIKEREKNGPYKNLFDLCKRVNLRKVSKRVLASLIKGGAMDCFNCPRATMFSALDTIVALAQKKNKEKQGGQLSLLSMVQQEDKSCQAEGLGVECPETKNMEWPLEEKLGYEKESLRIFLSGHPLLHYEDQLRMLEVTSIAKAQTMPRDSEVRLAFLLTEVKETVVKRGKGKGKKMAFCQIEDLSGRSELIIFQECYTKYKQALTEHQLFFCRAKTDLQEGGEQQQPKFIAEEIKPLSDVKIPTNKPVILKLKDLPDNNNLKGLKKIISQHPGENPVQIDLCLGDILCKLQLGPEFCVTPDTNFKEQISAWQTGLKKQPQSP